jgi:hypothetical protein
MQTRLHRSRVACVRACDVGSSRCIVLLLGVTPGVSCTDCEAAAAGHPKVILVAGFKCSACPKHKWLTICLVLGAILVVVGYLAYTIKKKQRAEAPKLRSASTCRSVPCRRRDVYGSLFCSSGTAMWLFGVC